MRERLLLKQLIAKQGMTRAEFAKEIGLQKRAVYSILAGGAVRAKTHVAIAKALQVAPEEIIRWEPKNLFPLQPKQVNPEKFPEIVSLLTKQCQMATHTVLVLFGYYANGSPLDTDTIVLAASSMANDLFPIKSGRPLVNATGKPIVAAMENSLVNFPSVLRDQTEVYAGVANGTVPNAKVPLHYGSGHFQGVRLLPRIIACYTDGKDRVNLVDYTIIENHWLPATKDKHATEWQAQKSPSRSQGLL